MKIGIKVGMNKTVEGFSYFNNTANPSYFRSKLKRMGNRRFEKPAKIQFGRKLLAGKPENI
jgi:hypothetical protein